MSQAQFKMLITSMVFTFIINAGVTFWVTHSVNKHTTEMSVQECSDKLFIHLKG